MRRLRELLRDPRARDAEQAFVVEGPRAVKGALDRGAALEHLYLGPGADRAFSELVGRARDAGVQASELKEGVLERLGSTVTPQPVLAVAPIPACDPSAPAPGDSFVLLGAELADPGNVGTLLRSAEAAGAAAIWLSRGSVDAYNPKVVRASAGAIFGIPIVEGRPIVEALEALAALGRVRVGTRASGGTPFHEAALGGPVAFVLGNEARGLGPELDAHVDDWVTIPMRGGAESLNVAMAGTLLCFEAARQRDADG